MDETSGSFNSEQTSFEQTSCSTFPKKNPKQRKCKQRRKGNDKITANPFFNFLRCLRLKLKDLPVTEVSKQGGKIWCNMTDEQKKPFIEMAEKVKAEYRKAGLYKVRTKGEDKVTKNPFFNFLRCLRKKMTNTRITEVASHGGKKWRKMTPGQKKPFIDMADLEKKQKHKAKTQSSE